MARGDDARRQRYIEWLCTPKRDREPNDQGALAILMGVSSTKLSKWKKEPEFIKAWEAHYLATIGSPERKQSLLDALHRTGSDPDDPHHVAAAKAYMDIVNGLKPQQIELTVKRPASDLTDEQLDTIIAQHAEREQHLRLVEGT